MEIQGEGDNCKPRALLRIIVLLGLLIGIRLLIKQLGFLFLEKIAGYDTLLSTISMLLLTLVVLLAAKKRKLALKVFPEGILPASRNKKTVVTYASLSLATALLIGSSLLFADDHLSLFFRWGLVLHSTVVTPIYEELLFRGYVWSSLKASGWRDLPVCLITMLLFGVWHLGYFDSVLLRVNDSSAAFIMFMKVLTGLRYGIITGLIRYKTKNTMAAILAHSAMNVLGR